MHACTALESNSAQHVLETCGGKKKGLGLLLLLQMLYSD